MINSCMKGKVGERELVEVLRQHGLEAHRGQQYEGSSDSPDVVCEALSFVHFECKRVEQGNLYRWLEQAQRDANPGQIPVVAHRRSRKEWVAIMPLNLAIELFKMVASK